MLQIRWTHLSLATLAACAVSGDYLYAPQNANSTSDGYPAASAQIPPEMPQGRVDVTSYGIVEIKPDHYAPLLTLHVRLAVANDTDAMAWTIAPSDHLVEIEGEGRSRPIFVNSDLQTLPTATIGLRERRVLDFYYPLPENISEADDLPAFSFLWQVKTGARVYGSTTIFERLDREPPNVRVVYHSGWGPYWWYDPMFDRAVFIHYRPIGFYRPGHVRVTRPPSWHYRPVRDHRR